MGTVLRFFSLSPHPIHSVPEVIPVQAPGLQTLVRPFPLDRDAKKSKISERPAEFTVHSRDNSKNFLLKSF